jgi:hypothetical protein
MSGVNMKAETLLEMIEATEWKATDAIQEILSRAGLTAMYTDEWRGESKEMFMSTLAHTVTDKGSFETVCLEQVPTVSGTSKAKRRRHPRR